MPSSVKWYGDALQRQVIRDGKEGVNQVTKAIAQAAPGYLSRGHGIDTGKLQRNIRTEPAKLIAGKITGKAGVTKRAWYGRLVASGTQPHKIVPKKGRYLVWKSKAVGYQLTDRWGRLIRTVGTFAETGAGAGVKSRAIYQTRKGKTTKQRSRGAAIFARAVRHPGSEANPFMNKALDQVWPEAPAIFAREVGPKLK